MKLINKMPVDYNSLYKETGMRRGVLRKSPVFGWGIFDEKGTLGIHFAEVTVPDCSEADIVKVEDDHWCFYKE